MSAEPQKIVSIDAEFLSGKRFPYQEDIGLVEGSKTVGENWRPPVLEGWEPPLH